MLDGYSKIDEMIAKTKEQGLTHIAITEHGNTYSLIPFYLAAKKEGITPILGCEFYWHEEKMGCRDLGARERKRTHHLTVLAKNIDGYYNLLKLVTLAHSEGFYYDPQIDNKTLFRHKEGLIVLSGCPAGGIPKLILEDKYDEAKLLALEYQKHFGEDFYLEIMNHDSHEINPSILELLEDSGWHTLAISRAKEDRNESKILSSLGKKKYVEEYKRRLIEKMGQEKDELSLMEKKIRQGLNELSKETGIKLVATNDSHYVNKQDAYMQDVFFALGQDKWLLDLNRYVYSTDMFYLRDPEEMDKIFADYPEALDSTREIAEKCNIEIKEIELVKQNIYQLPHYPDTPKDMTEDDCLRKLCEDGWQKLVKPRIEAGVISEQEYINRLDFELDTIIDMGWSGYFLIVQDLVNWAKNEGIPIGPSRGSAGSSLVSYLIGITEIDPLYMPIDGFCGEEQEPMGLLFGRFLNPERVSMPDIDIDISKKHRSRVVDYLIEKYGSDRVASIGTLGTLTCKASIKKVGQVLGVDFNKMNEFTKSIHKTNDEDLTVEAILDLPDIKKQIEKDPEIRMVIDIAKEAENMPQFFGTHAAGIVISNKPIWHYSATKLDKENVVTLMTMDEIENLGLLKVDLLGLRTLDVIQDTIDNVEQNRKVKIDIKNIPLNDKLTFQLYRETNVGGIFQVESNLNKNYLRKNQPHSFNCIVEQLALVRPGPLDAKADCGKISMTDEFFRRKHGYSRVKKIHPLADEILSKTYGIIVYQETAMALSKSMANFTEGEADHLRKAIGKKQIDKMEQLKSKFVQGCLDNKIPKEIAEQVWSNIETFGKYGFNKSHSVAYALVSYRTAYLKAHYPVEFMAALLSSVMDKPDKLSVYLEECHRSNIKVLPPDINISADYFVPVKDEIRFPLRGVKNVGDSGIEEIFRVKQKGKIDNLKDFVMEVEARKVNKTAIKSLIQAGAFDYLGIERKKMVEGLESFLKYHKSYKEKVKRQKDNLEKLELEPFSSIDEYQEKKQKIYDKLDSVEKEFQIRSKESFDIDVGEYSVHEIMAMEKELLGFYVSTSPYHWGKPYISLLDNCSSDEIPFLPRNTIVTIGGHIIELKPVRTRYGTNMAFGMAEDDNGLYKITIPPKVWEVYKPNAEDVCLFWGKTNGETEEGYGAFTVDKVKIITDEDVTKIEHLTSCYNNSIIVMIDDTVTVNEWLRYIDNALTYPNENSYRLIIYDALNNKEIHTNKYISSPNFIEQLSSIRGTLSVLRYN